MPRKLFPQITRHDGLVLYSKYEDIYMSEPLIDQVKLGHHALFSKSQTDEWKQQMARTRYGPTKAAYMPQRNGENHALTITAILDILLRVRHDSYVFPAGLEKELNEHYGHLVQFDPYTIGRVLTNLLSLAYSIGNPGERPMDAANHSGARMVMIRHDHPWSWRWIGILRETMGQRTMQDQALARSGEMVENPRDESIWLLLENLYAPELQEKVRETVGSPA